MLDIDKLNKNEIIYFSKILTELENTGNSSTLNSLYDYDYDELPVSIYEFIHNPDYLGKSFVNDDGSSIIYNYWIDYLNEIYSPNSPVNEMILTGCIGSGKSTLATVCLAYELHKLLCLKDPKSFYGIGRNEKIAIAFFNLSLDQVYGVGYSKLQSLCLNSDWFKDHGKVVGRKNITYHPGKDIEILAGSQQSHFLGRDIISGMLDEVDFVAGANMNMVQSKVFSLYNTIKRRIESRYMKAGKTPAKLILCSSKNMSQDFLSQYIEIVKNKPHVSIKSDPIWIVKKERSAYSGITFGIALGDKFKKPRILSDNEYENAKKQKISNVLDVPVEHKDAFELDLNSALADIAGIATISSHKYFNTDKVGNCFKKYLKNPFTEDSITLDFDDDISLKDYFMFDLIPNFDRYKPMYIHWDTSKSGDKTGLSMTTVLDSNKVKRLIGERVEDVLDVVHKVIFAIDITCTTGKEIPFFKIREFILYLRNELEFNIVSVTCDSWQSVDTLQLFKKANIEADILSVDTSILPYQSLKNAVNEGRLHMPYTITLDFEFRDVELTGVGNKLKVDHSLSGSKDVLDTIAANIFKANSSYNLVAQSDLKVINHITDLLLENNDIQDFQQQVDKMIIPKGTKIM
jgi:hypothetical protein